MIVRMQGDENPIEYFSADEKRWLISAAREYYKGMDLLFRAQNKMQEALGMLFNDNSPLSQDIAFEAIDQSDFLDDAFRQLEDIDNFEELLINTGALLSSGDYIGWLKENAVMLGIGPNNR